MSSVTKRIACGRRAIKQVGSRSLKKRPWIKFPPNPPRSTRAERLDGHRAKMTAKREGRWGWFMGLYRYQHRR